MSPRAWLGRGPLHFRKERSSLGPLWLNRASPRESHCCVRSAKRPEVAQARDSPMISTARTDEQTTFWTIRRWGVNEALSIDLGHRQRAAVCFTSHDRAISFLKADLVDRRWRAVEVSAPDLVTMLKQRCKQGTRFVYRDPANLFCLGQPRPIVDLLAE